jgi:phosphomethylpyrimidine synthase
MNANEKFIAADAHVDKAAVQPLPNSRKVYMAGSRPDIRVPMREISQADTDTAFGGEKNPPIYVYDCSGPYSDPQVTIDIRNGLPALRARWIAERSDSEPLPALSSDFGRSRAADVTLDEMRFPGLQRRPLRARPGANVSQMHYARRGMITPEMEYVAIRENGNNRQQLRRAVEGTSGPQGERSGGNPLSSAPRQRSRREHSGRDQLQSSSVPKWRAVGRSFRATSTTRKASR